MRTTRCINCMKIIEEGDSSCPHCGYGQNAEQSPFSMRSNTILKGRYIVGRVLGQGGFGITYVGYDLTLEIKIAIKEYFPSGAVTRNNTLSNLVQWNSTQLSREQWQAGCESFLKEARRMAKLDSLAGIVRVRDTFPENQTAYIVMDYIEGETLKDRQMHNGVMSLAECIGLLRPFMESLDKMHRQGLVHRDISPDNIMVQPDGRVCLLDFGAAKDISLQHSMSSQQVAKKGFSPPEQYREKGHIGSWTDVYALCATIYYCVTGRLVPDAMDRMYEDTLTFDIPLAEPLTGTTIQALQHGLKLRSEERIQTVGELLEQLEDAVRNPSEPQPYRDEKTLKEEQEEKSREREDGGNKQKRRINKKIVGVVTAAACCLLIVVKGINGLSSGTGDTQTEEIEEQAEDMDAAETEQAQIGGDTGGEKESVTALADEEDIVSVPIQEEAVEETKNILMKDDSVDWVQLCWQGTVLGSDISRDCISSVTFLDTLSNMPDNAWDASWEKNGAVMAWVESDGGADQMYDLYIGAEGGVQARNCKKLFLGYYNVEEINFNHCFDTSQTTDMSFMFDNCANLKELDLSDFDTSNVTDMYLMFYECASLTRLDLSSFDTGRVTDMGWMFTYCIGLQELDVSSFDTSQVTTMASMFSSCHNLQELDVSSFDTSQVTDMSYMFAYCNSLTVPDMSGFNTDKVETMEGIFQNCGLTAESTGLNTHGLDIN